LISILFGQHKILQQSYIEEDSEYHNVDNQTQML